MVSASAGKEPSRRISCTALMALITASATLDQRAYDVPFTTQTRLHFDVILPSGAVVAPGDFLPRRASLVPPARTG